MTLGERLQHLTTAKKQSTLAVKPVTITIGKEHFQYTGGELTDYEMEIPELLTRSAGEVRTEARRQTPPSVQRVKNRA